MGPGPLAPSGYRREEGGGCPSDQGRAERPQAIPATTRGREQQGTAIGHGVALQGGGVEPEPCFVASMEVSIGMVTAWPRSTALTASA